MGTDHQDGWKPEKLKRRLQAMDDYDFEHFIADLWERQGWETEVEQQSSDAGVDIRATKSTPYRQKVLIQAKRYSDTNPVGGPDIQQYSALKQQEGSVDKAIIATTGRFTGPAEDRAEDLNVKLIDGDDLVALIDELDAYDIVEQYLASPSASTDTESTSTDDTEPDYYLTPEDRAELESVIEGNLGDHIREQQYRATRALESAQGLVELNPHDANELGVFDGIEHVDAEREFEQHRTDLPFLKDDIHLDDDGEVFVEDLSDYVPGRTIDTDADKNIIGILERGVQDHAWVSDAFGAESRVKQAKGSTADESSSKLQSFAAGHPNLHYVSLGGLFLFTLGFFMVPTAESAPVTVWAGIGSLLVVTMPFVGITGLILDLSYIKQHECDWNPSVLAGIIGAMFFGLFYAPYYIYKRKKYIGL